MDDDSAEDHDPSVPADAYAQIDKLVRVHTAFRLSDYKSGTVHRRIARRMSALGIETLAEYIDRLRNDKSEPAALMRDTFISVTSFFRDESAFSVLSELIHDMVQARDDRGVIRAWVPGCATGEEAYGIALLFEEALRAANKAELQYMIFASDLDEAALEKARSGLYTSVEVGPVPIEMRERYLEPAGDLFRVGKGVRNRLVFARQNVAEDPPFAHIDLISCRNLLIYLVPSVKKRVIDLFHYALNPGGCLFLGKSESVDGHGPFFEILDAREKLYRRSNNNAPHSFPVKMGLPAQQGPREAERALSLNPDWVARRSLEVLAERFAPPAVVINEEDTIIHFQGDLQSFLRFPRGKADMRLFELVDPSVRAELRALVFRARRGSEVVRGGASRVLVGGRSAELVIGVAPLAPPQGSALLVTFETTPEDLPTISATGAAISERDVLIVQELERELARTREHLNLVVEELETANEELQSLNKELETSNQELQSANEELQTANEELQSTNEEMLTANEELALKSAALEVSERRYRRVTESLPQLVWTCDMTGACDYLGPQWVHYTGRSEAEQLGYGWMEQLHPDDRGRVNKIWAAAVRDGHLFECKFRIRRHDGLYRWFQTLAAPVEEEGGRSVKWFGSNTDIDAEVQAESTMIKSQTQLQLFIEHAPVGLALFDREMRYLAVSRYWCERFSLNKEEILGRNLYEVLPSVAPRYREVHRRALTGETVAVPEVAVMLPDGRPGWNRAEVLPWFETSGGEVGGVIILTQDITAEVLARKELQALNESLEQRVIERTAELSRAREDLAATVRRLDESLQQSERNLRLSSDILAGSPYGMVVFGPDNRALLWNEQFVQMLQIPREKLETPDWHLSELLRVLHARGNFGGDMTEDDFIAAVTRRLAARRADRVERRHPNGRWIEARSLPIEGDLTLLTYMDVTEQKENELRLAEANTAKSAFVVHLSHELRTPLNAIIGTTYTLEATDLTDDQRQQVATMKAASKLLFGQVNDVLDLAKVEAGEMALERSPFTLDALFADIDVLFRAQARAAGLTLTLPVLEGELKAPLIGDRQRILQLLVNLLGNALKFTPQGYVRVSVGVTARAESKISLRFSVADSGIGIAEGVLPRLFQPFAQADVSTARTHGGTGLGLSLVRRLAEWMGGTAGAESALGVGSTFWFEVPFELQENGSPKRDEHAELDASLEHLPGLRVLVVDDSQVNLEVVKRLLAHEGAKVTCAISGVAALKVLSAVPLAFDCVLMDAQMPVLDGYATTRELRAGGGDAAKIPVIALTAGAMSSAREKALRSGMNDYLTKPVEPQLLVRALREQYHLATGRPLPMRARAPSIAGAPPLKAVAASEEWAIVAALPGVDLAKAQRQLAGDAKLYVKLLQTGMLDARALMELLGGDMERGALVSACARLHRMGGMLANLGVTSLADLASRLEAACDAGEAFDPTVLAELDRGLLALAAALPALADDHRSVETREVPPEIGAKLQRLAKDLRAQRAAALSLTEEIATDLAATRLEPSFEPVVRALRTLHFEEALTALLGCVARLGEGAS